MYVHSDCRYFKNDNFSLDAACLSCRKYQSQPTKILIIKLSAIGDVLRTTPILLGLKRKYPFSCITWITEKKAVELLTENDYVDRLLVSNFAIVDKLKVEIFDILICLDKEIEAVNLAGLVRAKEKFGFGLDLETGKIIPLNEESRYAWQLGISDELKFRINKKSYQQIIFEMVRLEYKKDEYVLDVSDENKLYAQKLFSQKGISFNNLFIGINTGAGRRFVNKKWTEEGFIELIRLIRKHTDAKIVLLGGRNEEKRNNRLISHLGDLVYDIGGNHTIKQFVAIVDLCSLVISADTLALHIAIALKKKTVCFFGPTCEQEIDLYGRGIKIISPVDCRPCYKKRCGKEPNCMNKINPGEVFNAVEQLILVCRH